VVPPLLTSNKAIAHSLVSSVTGEPAALMYLCRNSKLGQGLITLEALQP